MASAQANSQRGMSRDIAGCRRCREMSRDVASCRKNVAGMSRECHQMPRGRYLKVSVCGVITPLRRNYLVPPRRSRSRLAVCMRAMCLHAHTHWSYGPCSAFDPICFLALVHWSRRPCCITHPRCDPPRIWCHTPFSFLVANCQIWKSRFTAAVRRLQNCDPSRHDGYRTEIPAVPTVAIRDRCPPTERSHTRPHDRFTTVTLSKQSRDSRKLALVR